MGELGGPDLPVTHKCPPPWESVEGSLVVVGHKYASPLTRRLHEQVANS